MELSEKELNYCKDYASNMFGIDEQAYFFICSELRMQKYRQLYLSRL